jgi:hypothetical protein
LADSHFEAANHCLENVRFGTPIIKPVLEKRKNGADSIETLIKKEEKWNKEVHSFRARMEDVFGIMKTTFKFLQELWSENVLQLDYLVSIAIGVYNQKIQ